VTLVHEFQHGKLAAAQDLLPLYDPGDASVYYAPWRPDPRPLGGLLQGIYAHLGIAQFWNVQRARDMTDDSLRAHIEFVRWRDDTWRACGGIAAASALTSAGRLFAGKVLAQLELLRAEQAPAEACRVARFRADFQSAAWRLRNLEVDPQAARRLAAAWLADGAAEQYPASRYRPVPREIPVDRIRSLGRSLDVTLI